MKETNAGCAFPPHLNGYESREKSRPDILILIRAIDDARGILREFIEPGPSDAMRTVERLLILLDRNDVLHALDRTKRRRVIRLVE